MVHFLPSLCAVCILLAQAFSVHKLSAGFLPKLSRHAHGVGFLPELSVPAHWGRLSTLSLCIPMAQAFFPNSLCMLMTQSFFPVLEL
jgi:hypothetical protein